MYKSFSKSRLVLCLPAIIMALSILGYCTAIFYLNVKYPVSASFRPYDHDVYSQYVHYRLSVREVLEKVVFSMMVFSKYLGIIVLLSLPEPYFSLKKGAGKFLSALLIMIACIAPFVLLDSGYKSEYMLPLFKAAYILLILFILYSLKCLLIKKGR